MTEPSAIALKVLKPLLDDLYKSAKDKSKSALKKWQNTNNIKTLHKKISSIRNVKTIWQIDKEVDLKRFYYPSKLIIDNNRTNISCIEKIPSETNTVIQGTVGQGKSIFLRYLCSQELKIGKKIPLFIELRKIDDKNNLKDLIFSTLDAWDFEIDEELFDFFAQSGCFILLLDGFDEIHTNYVSQSITQLENWSKKFEKLKIIVTARPDSGIERSSFFRVFNLAPLNEEDQVGIVERLTTNDNQRFSLLTALQSNSSKIRDLLTTPLMITLLVIIYKSTHKVPEEFSEFYEDLFQTLLIRHDKTKPGYSRERKCKVNERKLQEIFEAFSFLCTKRKLINISESLFHETSADAIKIINIECETAAFIHDIVKISCLILEEGRQYHFIHKSVREFYSAKYIKKRPEEFLVKFYSEMAEKPDPSWMQELNFLSQIDNYKYNRYFLKKHVELIFEYFKIDHHQPITITASESVLKTEKFLVGLGADFSIAEIRHLAGGRKFIRDIFNPFECIVKAIIERSKSNFSKTQKEQIKSQSYKSDDSHSIDLIDAIAFAEAIGAKQKIMNDIHTILKKLQQDHHELSEKLRHEESTISLLDP